MHEHFLIVLYSNNHDQLYKHIIHIHLHLHAEHSDTIKTRDTVLRKIYLSLYLKGLCVRGSWRPNRTATYWPPTLLAITAFLSRTPGLLNRAPGGPASLGAGFLYCILSPTDWISCALSYIIVQQPPSSCGCHKLHSFNPSTVKGILCYSSTGCPCYLHWCISHFDSLTGS